MSPIRRPLMIFGAGFGTRMGALTAARPKPLIEVAGMPLIDRALRIGAAAGADPIVVNTHYLHDQMADHLAATGVKVSHETPDILDTGGGLRQARSLLGDGPVFTLNPDCVWSGPNPLSALSAAWRNDTMGALLLLVRAGQSHAHSGGGDFDLSADGRLSRPGPYIYTGAQIIDPSVLHDIDATRFSLNIAWNRLAERQTLFGVVYEGDWCDVGHPDGITAAEALLKARTDV